MEPGGVDAGSQGVIGDLDNSVSPASDPTKDKPPIDVDEWPFYCPPE